MDKPGYDKLLEKYELAIKALHEIMNTGNGPDGISVEATIAYNILGFLESFE